jgi:outer membrane protein assembly factor BamB
MQKLLSFALVAVLSTSTVASAGDWSQFRGADNKGRAAEAKLPPDNFQLKSDAGEAKNVAWSVDLPARGVSGPIVVGDRVFVTGASGPKQDRLHVICYSAADGRTLWHRQFWATGRTVCHPTSSVAANTPASDGSRVFAFFSSNDLAALDLDGNLLWYRGLTLEHPSAANDVGMAASPLVVAGNVVVQVESKGESFAAALDAATGETRWRVPRTAQMNWTSPTIYNVDPAKPAVLLQSPDKLTAHDAKTGEVLWTFDEKCGEISSATSEGDVIYLPSNGLTALRAPAGSGNWEKVWQESQLGPGNSSPVVSEGRVFVVNRAGALTCGDAATGKVLWRQRLKGPYWATPMAVGDRLYFVNADGVMQVVKASAEAGEITAESKFDEAVLGSPAYADGALYVRGEKHLFKIAKP